MVEISSARFAVTSCVIFSFEECGSKKCLLMTGRAHTTRNVEQPALFRATLLPERECNTWCRRKPSTWYLHHANLQILSDDALYMVSPQTHYLVTPPCKPSNLIWFVCPGWVVAYLLISPLIEHRPAASSSTGRQIGHRMCIKLILSKEKRNKSE